MIETRGMMSPSDDEGNDKDQRFNLKKIEKNGMIGTAKNIPDNYLYLNCNVNLLTALSTLTMKLQQLLLDVTQM